MAVWSGCRRPSRSSRARTARPAAEPPRTRTADARLSRLHLRGGLLTLARAELEQMAGAGSLDREALADLAEARWRSGDLEGAAEAADAHLGTGGDEPIAHLIVAEEAERQGRILDARQRATLVQQRVGEGIERLFAGEHRSTVWPVGLARRGWTGRHGTRSVGPAGRRHRGRGPGSGHLAERARHHG